jgi:DNA (cytosine-5)-methyltransferase 1
MSKFSFFSTHSGAGGACLGAEMAGLQSVGGVEIDDYCADLHRTNFGNGIRHESILDTPIEQLPDFDFLWGSPPCPSFSIAKTDGVETHEDIAQAKKIADIIRIKKPRYFAIENVRGYVDSESFKIILLRIQSLGYNTHYDIYDAADFGVPQNRHRLILRAGRDPLLNLLPTHSKTGGLWWQPWNNWYDAIAELLPSCKPSRLTERQVQTLKNKEWSGNILVDGKGNKYGSSYTASDSKTPSFTITANMDRNISRAVLVKRKLGGGGRSPKALLVGGSTNEHRGAARDKLEPSNTITASTDRQVARAVIIERTGYGDRDPITLQSDEPSQTIRASVGCDERGGFRSPFTALLESADVRALDYRCLARLQSFPDSYVWGKSAGKNCRAIGNAVPVLFAQRIIESIVHP